MLEVQYSGQCALPVSAPACVVGNRGVRSLEKKPKDPCSTRGLQARRRPGWANASEPLMRLRDGDPRRWDVRAGP
jgi:hypothetical protein